MEYFSSRLNCTDNQLRFIESVLRVVCSSQNFVCFIETKKNKKTGKTIFVAKAKGFLQCLEHTEHVLTKGHFPFWPFLCRFLECSSVKIYMHKVSINLVRIHNLFKIFHNYLPITVGACSVSQVASVFDSSFENSYTFYFYSMSS